MENFLAFMLAIAVVMSGCRTSSPKSPDASSAQASGSQSSQASQNCQIFSGPVTTKPTQSQEACGPLYLAPFSTLYLIQPQQSGNETNSFQQKNIAAVASLVACMSSGIPTYKSAGLPSQGKTQQLGLIGSYGYLTAEEIEETSGRLEAGNERVDDVGSAQYPSSSYESSQSSSGYPSSSYASSPSSSSYASSPSSSSYASSPSSSSYAAGHYPSSSSYAASSSSSPYSDLLEVKNSPSAEVSGTKNSQQTGLSFVNNIINPNSVLIVNKDHATINASLIFGTTTTGELEVKNVKSVDQLNLKNWDTPQVIAFKKGDILEEEMSPLSNIFSPLKEGSVEGLDIIIDKPPLTYAIKSRIHTEDGEYFVGTVTKNLSPSGQAIQSLFPNFTPTKQAGGGITGDVYFGTLLDRSASGVVAKEVVAKKIPQDEYNTISNLSATLPNKGEGVMVPILAQDWTPSWDAQVPNTYGILMEKAYRDGQTAIGSDGFNFTQFAGNVSEAVKKMHATGVAHLDIKPGNVLQVQKDGAYVLADFGEARKLGVPTSVNTGDPKYRPTWRKVDTTISNANSKSRLFKADTESDIYAMGAMLGEVYLTKVKGKTVPEPEFSLLERWRDNGRKANNPLLREYNAQSSKFKNQIQENLDIDCKSGDQKACLFYSMMQDPKKHPVPTATEVANALKVQLH